MVKKQSASEQSSAAPRKSVEFQILSEPGSRVFVAGSFTKWAIGCKALKDKNNDGTYCAKIALEPGTYEYKFIVNDTWIPDPGNPRFNINELGTLNSVVVVE